MNASFLYGQTIYQKSDWRGYITINNSTLPFLIHLSKSVEYGNITGTCESPQQTQQAYTLNNIQLSDTDAHFEFNAGYGNVVFNGILHGDSIDGTYTQNQLSGDFALIKYHSNIDTSKNKPSSDFYEENVVINFNKTSLAGTLSKPGSGSRPPVVILITARGSQDRDESVYGFKPFKILADQLASQNYAVLRMDDRGTGLSKGKIVEASTTVELTDDIQQAINYLHTRTDVDANHIALLGHCEGATIAALVAANNPEVKCIVALTPPALKGSEIEIEELDSAREPKTNPEFYKAYKKALAYYFAHPGLKQPDDSLLLNLNRVQSIKYHGLNKEEKMKYADSVNFIKYMSTVMKAQIFSRWYRFYKGYDPRQAWLSVKCPVLAVYASKDKEISTTTNRALFSKCIKAPSTLTLITVDGANHLFEKAQTGLPSEYSKLTKDFVPGFTVIITRWLQGNFSY